MEIFLLLLDEIDDAVVALRYCMPRLLELLTALLLFGLTVVAALSWPFLMVASVMAGMLALLLAALRLRAQLRLKTDV